MCAPVPADHDTSAPVVSFTLSGISGTNGWFRSDVTIRWSVLEPEGLTSTTGCEIAKLVTTEGTTSHTCTATSHGGTASSTATLKLDKTLPRVPAGTAARPPDANGWYNRPVVVTFTATDAVSGIGSCAGSSYGGPDSATASAHGSCTDVAGNTSAAAVTSLKYDTGAPVVSASADRPPDGGGWYRRPLTVSFTGTDALSGIASCTAPARYAGPDRAAASLAGSCRDGAGNAAETTHTFRYDATPPKPGKLTAEGAKGIVRLGWKRPVDAVVAVLVRRPGVNGARSTTVYRGAARSFVDRTVRNGVRYRYELRLLDAAGNEAAASVTATPRPRLYRPAAGTVVRSPLVLAWDRVEGARFYNVQLLRDGVKVLSAWPVRATLRVGKPWRYLGRRQALEPGRYRWFVWAARGTRAQPRYGRPLGSSTFTVRRR